MPLWHLGVALLPSLSVPGLEVGDHVTRDDCPPLDVPAGPGWGGGGGGKGFGGGGKGGGGGGKGGGCFKCGAATQGVTLVACCPRVVQEAGGQIQNMHSCNCSVTTPLTFAVDDGV